MRLGLKMGFSDLILTQTNVTVKRNCNFQSAAKTKTTFKILAEMNTR